LVEGEATPAEPAGGGWQPAALKWVTLALPVAAYITMVIGAYVKAVYGGMACPEWPTCMDGNVIVPLTNEQIASEVIHRGAALVVSLAGVLLLFLALTRFRSQRRLLVLTLLAAATLGVQVGLGALTIFSNLEAVVVTLHLAVATIFFMLTPFIAQEARRVLRPGGGTSASGTAPTTTPST
jgi:heme A synthase